MVDQQLRHNDCGISAIKTICNLLEVNVDREVIKSQVPLSQQGATIGGLSKFFNDYGFKTRFKLLDINTVNDNENPLDGWFPAIMPVKSEGGLHYIVLNDLSKGKFSVYDPAKDKPYKLTVSELKSKAYFSSSYLDFASFDDKIRLIIGHELSQRGIALNTQNLPKELAVIYFNKITYASYVSESFGFKDAAAEKAFYEDLLFNQELKNLPKHFQNAKLEGNQLRLKTPLLLSVSKDAPIEAIRNEAGKDENIYVKLIKSISGIKGLWYIFLSTTIISSLISYLAVFVNQILIDHILPSYQLHVLTLFAIGLGVFELFMLCLSIYKRYVSIHLGNLLDKYFLSVFDARLNTHSIRFLQSFRRGDLSERLSDSMKIKKFFMRLFSKIFVNLMVALISTFILFAINWKLSLLVVLVMGIFVIMYKVITPIIKRLEQERFKMKADLFSKFIEKIDGLQVIKTHGLETYSSRNIAEKVDGMIQISTKGKYVSLVNSTVSSVVIMVFSLIIIVSLSKEMILFNLITLGQIITFMALSAKIFSAAKRLLDANIDIQEHQVILNRFFDFSNDPFAKPEISTKNRIENFEFEHIEVKKVSFGYVQEVNILTNINFKISKSDKVWIQGSNGSGKSTFCKIISFLYEPSEGKIYCNDLVSTAYHPKQLRENIVLVTNEDIIFNDTMLFNITLGASISMEKIIDYTQKLNLYDLIDSKPEQFDFIIHENGKNLSTGQRKKVLLLRALFSPAPIIILDEIFYGMDKNSKKQAERLIDETMDKTFIIISHEDISNIHFNKHYQISDGKLLAK